MFQWYLYIAALLPVWCSLSNIFAPAAWPQMMKKHFIRAWNPWITGGCPGSCSWLQCVFTVQGTLYDNLKGKHAPTICWWELSVLSLIWYQSCLTAIPCVPILDTRQARYRQITSWASAILDASHYCLLLTLTRLRVNRTCPMKILAPFIQEKVAYWIY